MSKFFAIALVAALTARQPLTSSSRVTGLACAIRTSSVCKTEAARTPAKCTCPNPDCPQYQYQTQTGAGYQWAGPEDDWGMFMWQFFGWWE